MIERKKKLNYAGLYIGRLPQTLNGYINRIARSCHTLASTTFHYKHEFEGAKEWGASIIINSRRQYTHRIHNTKPENGYIIHNEHWIPCYMTLFIYMYARVTKNGKIENYESMLQSVNDAMSNRSDVTLEIARSLNFVIVVVIFLLL